MITLLCISLFALAFLLGMAAGILLCLWLNRFNQHPGAFWR